MREVSKTVAVRKADFGKALQDVLGIDLGSYEVNHVGMCFPDAMGMVEVFLIEKQFANERRAAEQDCGIGNTINSRGSLLS